MTGLTLPDFLINPETLIGEARTARERQADEQVAAHIRAVLSRLRSHKPKGDAHALR
jgi:peptidase E